MPVIQPMASIQVLPLGNYANGTRVMGPVDIADNVTSVLFSIACNTVANPTIWPLVTTVLDIKPEVSVDGGLTWIEAGRSVTPGGPHTTKSGGELQTVMSGGSLPAPASGITRQYRVTTIISGGPLRASATVEVN